MAQDWRLHRQEPVDPTALRQILSSATRRLLKMSDACGYYSEMPLLQHQKMTPPSHANTNAGFNHPTVDYMVSEFDLLK